VFQRGLLFAYWRCIIFSCWLLGVVWGDVAVVVAVQAVLPAVP
jgi:hypothetical protein